MLRLTHPGETGSHFHAFLCSLVLQIEVLWLFQGHKSREIVSHLILQVLGAGAVSPGCPSLLQIRCKGWGGASALGTAEAG